MDVREKLVEICFHEFCEVAGDSPCGCDCCPYGEYGSGNGECYEAYKKGKLEKLEKSGVTVQEWVKVEERTPTEADGTVLVCLVDVFPYNEKEPYIGAKHDGRITEAHYSEFSDSWYIRGSVVPYGDVTHWMPLPQPPKGD